MFEVEHIKNRAILTVYGIRTFNNSDKTGKNTEFLFMIRGEWIWNNASLYIPYHSI